VTIFTAITKRMTLSAVLLMGLLATSSAVDADSLCNEGEEWVCTGGEKGVICACLGGTLEEDLIFDFGGALGGGFDEALDLVWGVGGCPSGSDGAEAATSANKKQVELFVTLSDPNGIYEPKPEKFELGQYSIAIVAHRFSDFPGGQSNPVAINSAYTHVSIEDGQKASPGASCQVGLVSARQYSVSDGQTRWSITNAWPSKFSGPDMSSNPDEASRLLIGGSSQEALELFVSAACSEPGAPDSGDASLVPPGQNEPGVPGVTVSLAASDPYGAIAPTRQEIELGNGDFASVPLDLADYETGDPFSTYVLIEIEQEGSDRYCNVDVSYRLYDKATGQTRGQNSFNRDRQRNFGRVIPISSVN